MSEDIITIKNACPFCQGDIVGNEKYQYYCKHCNVLMSYLKRSLK